MGYFGVPGRNGESGYSGMSGGGALKGAGGGAMAGFAVGGPVGGLIGAGIGGLAGLFGDSGESEQEAANRKRLEDFYGQVGKRQAPQMGPAAQGAYSGFRGNQQDLITRLDALSRGQGPSLAMEQMKAATDRNAAQQQAFANSGRGGPLAAQMAMNNTARLGAQAAQDSTMARIAEQQKAMELLGLNIHGARGQDESMNQFNAGQTNQTALHNLDARLRAMQLDDNTRLQILQQMGGAAQAQASRPGLGDQILAGGAGMYTMGATQAANQGFNDPSKYWQGSRKQGSLYGM